MAGGKLSARQKMINLMYLIFIAMLALNMSKEVLSAFGLMNEKLVDSNQAAAQRNTDFFAGLEQQALEQPDKFRPLLNQATQVQSLANDLNTYIADLKGQMTSALDDPQDYEIMDKGDFLDNYFFIGEKLKPEGEDFINKMASFRNGIKEVIGETYPGITADVEKKFATEPVTNRDGNVLDWLDYHYRGFPLVASLTKMTQLQADIKTTESEVMSTMLQGKLKIEASLTNFDAIVVPDKTAFFSGENFTGTIILGKKDNTLTADKVIVNGNELAKDAMQAGQTKLSFPAGAVGERDITGEFQFVEGGETITIPIKSSYAVVPKPNSATVFTSAAFDLFSGLLTSANIEFIFSEISLSEIFVTIPFSTSIIIGSCIKFPSHDPSMTILPFIVSSFGKTKTRPDGKFMTCPGLLQIPLSSVLHLAPILNLISVPPGDVTLTSLFLRNIEVNPEISF